MATCPAMWARIGWGRTHLENFISSPVTPFSMGGPCFPTSFCYNADLGKNGSPSVGRLRGGGDLNEPEGGQLDQSKLQASRRRTESNSLSVPV